MISAWRRCRGCSRASNLEIDSHVLQEQWFQSLRSEMWVLPSYLDAFEIRRRESSHLRCVHFLNSTSISSTASILSRSEDCNRTATVNTVLASYMEAAMKRLWARCEKRQIVRSELRHTLNTKHWALTGNSQKRQVHWTQSMVNRWYYNSTE